jgi:hypothetical protein
MRLREVDNDLSAGKSGRQVVRHAYIEASYARHLAGILAQGLAGSGSNGAAET